MYIIKNCDAIYKHPVGHWNCANGIECQRHEGCLMKQIIELCKQDIEQWKAIPNVDILEGCVSNKILQLLQIEEVE